MPLDLTSVHAKLKRAEEHLNTVRGEIATWINSSPYRVERQLNAQFTRLSMIVRLNTTPDLERWSLIAGDCIHNLRSALEHLVFAIRIHESGTNSPPDERDIFFPISDKPETFKKASKRLRNLDPAVLAAIEALQPYNRHHTELPPLLGLVRDFEAMDKHHLLQVAVSKLTDWEFRNLRGLIPEQYIMAVAHKGEVKDGTEVAALAFDRPTPDVRYDSFDGTLVIALPHAIGPLGSGHSEVVALLRLLLEEVRTAIDRVVAVK